MRQNFILDFVYIGAPRAGSTWLAAVMDEHPDTWIPHNKEIHYFNDRLLYTFEYKYPKGIDYYKSYFRDAPAGGVLGDLSPFYYYDPNAAYRIYKAFPDVKIVAMLRSPADVIYSLYLLLRHREKREDTFEKELIKNPQFLDLGFYHRLLTPYFDWFPKENIYIGIFEEFFTNEEKSCEKLFEFLEINKAFKPSQLGTRINVAKTSVPGTWSSMRGVLIETLNSKALIPIKNMLHYFKINKIDYSSFPKNDKNKQKYEMLPETRKMLIEQFYPDIKRLETQIGTTLDHWYK